MSLKITAGMKKQGVVVAAAMVTLIHTAAVDVQAAQEPLYDRAITHGYGVGSVTILGEVLPVRGANPPPSRVWVILRGVFGYEERQLVGRRPQILLH